MWDSKFVKWLVLTSLLGVLNTKLNELIGLIVAIYS
jgi:hypothetical protein